MYSIQVCDQLDVFWDIPVLTQSTWCDIFALILNDEIKIVKVHGQQVIKKNRRKIYG